MSKFKLFVVVALMSLMVSSMGADITFDSTTTDDAWAASSGGLYGDADASDALMLARSAVKIMEDITLSNGTVIESVASGSGVVVAYDEERDSGLVMTANHVCDVAYPAMSPYNFYLVLKNEMFVVTMGGKKLRMSIVHADPENDICVVSVDGNPGVPATFASFYPQLQGIVYTAGAPEGEWDINVVNVVSGGFSGVLKKRRIGGARHRNFSQYSLPIVGGMSGSAVFYRGRIIGILTHGSGRGYSHLAWGPNLLQVKRAYVKAVVRWVD